MAKHTSFSVGGPADLYIKPEGQNAKTLCQKVLVTARNLGVPVFILGGGANLVVADKGIRGLVLDTTGCTAYHFLTDASGTPFLQADAGLAVDGLVEACAARSYGGFEFLAGMPGTVGGAVWMNARCYGRSISDILVNTTLYDEALELQTEPARSDTFGYKKSPFQTRNVLIVGATFRLEPGEESVIRAAAQKNRQDREEKGHYRLPSAGSAFKNNYTYGQPTGKIVDELGLRGYRYGGAAVAPWHGNIIVNEGGATAADIKEVVDYVRHQVQSRLGLTLEPEILFVGDWS